MAREDVTSFAPDAPGMSLDPYPAFAELREKDPLHRSDLGYWVVSRHEDVRGVLMGRDSFGQGDFVENIRLFYGPDFDVLGQRSYKWLSEVFLMQDPPHHTRVRGMVTGALTAKRVRAMEGRICEIADELIDAMLAAGSADLITDFAYQLPVRVMCDMLGIDPEDPRLPAVIGAIAQSFIVFEARALTDTELATANEQISILQAFFEDLFEQRMAEPRDDLATALVQSGGNEDSLSHDELVTVAIGLFGAGFETTAHMIGNAVLSFARFPDEWAKLVADPSGMAAGAVDETLRFESSLIATYRTALAETQLRGETILPGEKVLTLIGAGNRDPRVFDDPDRFDIARDARGHLSFGGGIHFCAGAELARLEGRVAFEQLARRIPTLKADASNPQWRDGFLFRGLSSLPVSW
ncbi:putative cytochrome P450 hydroxylase [Altererythrobacter epoxidivorans]|uniref:Putative cytochrome P450 hydroxylase n=1 Tax=Altererythrobacter epoxidivorans TaxID=361183 RepID=A0A0M4LVW6_9SPHN|nr:cytochrome P450 [Altererythrobacter epoxidivorans]ALE17367.1 putative cytochrome P450 hydroxylase [Altererythrobacter epoxidivorans]